jgi:hypothetical protein
MYRCEAGKSLYTGEGVLKRRELGVYYTHTCVAKQVKTRDIIRFALCNINNEDLNNEDRKRLT